MKEKINVAELLKDCPKGMELDCTICNGVKFIELDRNPNFPIVVRANNGYEFSLTKYGQVHNIDDAKCVIFPKGKTTWEGFVPPCKFKKGDIVFTCTGRNNWVSIFKQFSRDVYRTYIDLCIDDNDWFIDTRCLCSIEEITTQRLATEEEKAKLFKAIKDNGYKWNKETKTLEKLIEPKFKVGDRIRQKGELSTYTISDIKDSHYFCGNYLICDTCDDNWELVPDKFNINVFRPFDKVLMRSSNAREWTGTIFSHYSNNKFYGCGMCCDQCIPYEGNEHLLGTTNDCDGFYKIWK